MLVGQNIVTAVAAFACVELIRVNPFLGIAVRVFAADEESVAHFGPDVTADITIRHMVAVVEVIIIVRRRAVHDFMAQGFGLDIAAVPDPFGHLVDFVRMGSGHIDDNTGIKLCTIF